MYRSPILAVLAALALHAAGSAQRVRAVAPIGAIGPGKNADEDVGVPVKMFENPNLDRYLRRAQEFLQASNYVAAIEVLQDVIQGRTIEFVGSNEGLSPPATGADGDGSNEPTEPSQPNGETPAVSEPAGREANELDAANSVFSHDGRLYRPVRRLCHELLARMPPVGIELYRTLHEVRARELLDAAIASGSVFELEQVVNRYFVTLSAGEAMVLLGDRFMHEGRYRAAVQVLRDLIEVYPAANLARVGVDPVWCEFKIALCLRMAGELRAAREQAARVAAAHPDDSLRILGELQSVRDLPSLPIFADGEIATAAELPAETGPSWLVPRGEHDIEDLIPLWQYRFVDPQPYRGPKSVNANNQGAFNFNNGGSTMTAMPHADRYGPASWIRFVPAATPGADPEALFFDHFCLRDANARTGLLLHSGDGAEAPPKPREGHPRVRIAASDFALLRPIVDATRYYAVLGHQKNTSQTVKPLQTSTLVAYDRATMARLWDSEQWLDGDDGLRDVTFLAAPTIFGQRLLLPALRRDAYSLECIDAASGRPLWHAMLHSGGSPYYKAPGTPVVVTGGTAFVLTNAGCLAAVDAFAGDLRWIRRYEREDPLRPMPHVRGRGEPDYGRGMQFVQGEIAGFLPNDLIVDDGLVIFGACDSGMLVSLDSASGEPVWMVDAASRYAPWGKLDTIVGAVGGDLFATSDQALVCISLRGGLVKWMRELPEPPGQKNVGRGRGTIVGNRVLLPGDREILVFDAAGVESMQRLPLPSFGVSEAPLPTPFNLVASGPWLGLGYRNGVEVLSSSTALRQLAGATSDPWIAAGLRLEAGDELEAEKILFEWINDPDATAADRRRSCRRLLSLVRERALRLAADDHLRAALAAFDQIDGLCTERELRLGWHLARIEVCGAANDLRAHEEEQQRLYDFMEGKR